MDVDGDRDRERGESVRALRALATASRFLETLERESPGLVVALRAGTVQGTAREAQHLEDGLRALAELALALESHESAGPRPRGVHGDLTRSLRDFAEARAAENRTEAAAVLERQVLPSVRSWRHWFQSRLETRAADGEVPVRRS